MRLKRTCVCCFSLILLVVSAGIIAISLYIHLDFAQIMENRIKEQMIIKEENAFYEDWIKSKTIERTNFYVFEVENPSEILSGKKPRVKEVGPFVFRVERIKEKVTFSFDKTLVSYVERKVYHFIEMFSSGSIDDKITTVNIHFMTLNPMLNQLGQTTNSVDSRTNKSAVDSIFETFASNVFTQKTVRQILFGGETDPQLERLSKYWSQLMPKDFSLFHNNTEQKFEEFTGYKTGLYGRILKWNDKSSLSVWTGKSCNQINGSHGLHFSPLIDRSDRIYEYSTEMCRSIEMSYENHLESEGIPLLRFSPVDNIFHSPYHNTKNKCYCLSPERPEKCNFIGILDLFSCTFGAPIIVSNPHFRRTSEVIAKSVVGLSPDEELHKSYVEIEPLTGLVVHRKRRYQFNVHIRKCPLDQNSKKYLKESIIPMVWFDEVSERDDTTKDVIRLLFIYPTQYEELIALALIGLAVVMLITSLCCCCCCGKNKKIDPNSGHVVSDKPIKTISDQTFDHRIDESHNYDTIFKGQTTLNRLKDNPPKRPSTVRQNLNAIDSYIKSSPPPPPPPPPPPLPSEFMPISNPINTNLPQNLLKDIQMGTELRKIDKTVINEIKYSDPIVCVSNQNQKSVQKGPIMTSLAKELEERMRRKSLDNYSSGTGPQSYYRWHNTSNPTNYSTLDRRTLFRTPPVPIRRASADTQNLIKLNDTIDSDFSDCEEQEEYGREENHIKPLKSVKKYESNVIISNSLPFDCNQSLRSNSIITDIYHIL